MGQDQRRDYRNATDAEVRRAVAEFRKRQAEFKARNEQLSIDEFLAGGSVIAEALQRGLLRG